MARWDMMQPEKFYNLFCQKIRTESEANTSSLKCFDIIKPHTRTVFVKRNEDSESFNKFKLNIPKMIFFSDRYDYVRVFCLNEQNLLCYVPFPNVNVIQTCCFGGWQLSGRKIDSKSDFINGFFNTYFAYTWYHNVNKYINKLKNLSHIHFYNDWESNGTLELIPYMFNYEQTDFVTLEL